MGSSALASSGLRRLRCLSRLPRSLPVAAEPQTFIQIREAIEVPDTVYYSIPLCELTDPDDLTRGFDVVATGTLLEVEGERFAVTANHVFDEYEPKELLYPTSLDELTTFGGTALTLDPRLAEVDGPARNIDIAALRIGKPVHSEYQHLDASQFAPHAPIAEGETIVLQGYPLTGNKTPPKSRAIRTRKREIEGVALNHEEYVGLGLSPDIHLAVRIDPEGLPRLQGMSGGPMWLRAPAGLGLAGVITDNPPEALDIVFGTRVSVISGALAELVQQHLQPPSVYRTAAG